MARGALLGQLPVAVAGAAAFGAYLAASDPSALAAELLATMTAMLTVYAPYAGLVGIGATLRLVPL